MSKSSSKKQMEPSNHCFEDEELHCLIEAKKLFHAGYEGKDCEKCHAAWRLVDQAILAKYTTLAKEYKEKADGV